MSKSNPEKIFLIINQYAGHKEGARAVDLVIPYLRKKNNQVEYAFTRYAGHATELARQAVSEKYSLVVAVGGDGTVNEVAQALVGSGVPLGIVPMGSGNGLARELNIPMEIKGSRKTLNRGKNLELDVCRLNQQRFLCTAGIGFDAMIAYKMSRASSRGFLKYVQLVIRESLTFKPLDVKIIVDGKPLQRKAFLITFANASQFGNNAYIAPQASMTDGLIDVVIVNRFMRIWMPLFAVTLFLRKITWLPFVECYKARQIDIESARTPYFHFDGEPGELQLPARVAIDEQTILVRCMIAKN